MIYECTEPYTETLEEAIALVLEMSGLTQNGEYAKMKQDTERAKFNNWLGIKHCGAAHDLAWEAWKARAALEAKQAEVKMPEPVGVAHHGQLDNIKDGYAYIYPIGSHAAASCKLYTEQQLRALLAQHGIKIA